MNRAHKHQQYRQHLTPPPVDPGLRPNAAGRLDPEAYRAYLEKRLTHGFNGKPSRLIGFVPPGGAEFGIKTGSAREWANFMTRLSFHEGEIDTRGTGDGGRSHALFGLSPGDSAIIGARKAGDLGRKIGGDFTVAELRDPRLHTDAAIALLESKLLDTPQGNMRKSLSYWGPIKNEQWQPGLGRDYVLREGADGKLTIDRMAELPPGGVRNYEYGKRMAQLAKQQKQKKQVADMRAAGSQTTRRHGKHRHKSPKRDYAGQKTQRKHYSSMGHSSTHHQPHHAATPPVPPRAAKTRVASMGL